MNQITAMREAIIWLLDNTREITHADHKARAEIYAAMGETAVAVAGDVAVETVVDPAVDVAVERPDMWVVLPSSTMRCQIYATEKEARIKAKDWHGPGHPADVAHYVPVEKLAKVQAEVEALRSAKSENVESSVSVHTTNAPLKAQVGPYTTNAPIKAKVSPSNLEAVQWSVWRNTISPGGVWEQMEVRPQDEERAREQAHYWTLSSSCFVFEARPVAVK
jgi:hypothetical protein